jgi:hypothetical protein
MTQAAPAAGTAWRDLVDRADGVLGTVSPALARHWRTELDEVEQRVARLERSAPEPDSDDGVHAFVALATARLADEWDPQRLIDVAAAVELAHRATRHHAAILNATPDDARSQNVSASQSVSASQNVTVVLDGDWSITQAAVLVADIGPAAYRILVRGYGATQVGQLAGVSDPLGLVRAAVALSALVAELPASAVQELWAATHLPPARRSTPAAVLAWAVTSQVGGTNARSVPASIDAQLPARSTTTSPAVGKS